MSIKIVCIIATHKRFDITIENIKYLFKQTLPFYKIVLVGDSDMDRKIADDNNIVFLKVKNFPLGNKWQMGVDLSREFNPDAIVIHGSDNFLSPGWVKLTYSFLKKYDVIGAGVWYACHIENNKKIIIVKRSYSGFRSSLPLGSGRIISKDILNKLNWEIFPRTANKCLDGLSYSKIQSVNGKILALGDIEQEGVLDVKSDWKSIHDWTIYKKNKGLLVHVFPDSINNLEKVFPNISTNLLSIKSKVIF